MVPSPPPEPDTVGTAVSQNAAGSVTEKLPRIRRTITPVVSKRLPMGDPQPINAVSFATRTHLQ
jgi:hypothetical protein